VVDVVDVVFSFNLKIQIFLIAELTLIMSAHQLSTLLSQAEQNTQTLYQAYTQGLLEGEGKGAKEWKRDTKEDGVERRKEAGECIQVLTGDRRLCLYSYQQQQQCKESDL